MFNNENFFKNLFLFLAVLGLCYCAGFFLVAACGLPICSSFSCCAARALGCMDFSGCSFWALDHRPSSRYMGLVALWHLRSGIEPMSPVLAGRFSTPEPSGKPSDEFL